MNVKKVRSSLDSLISSFNMRITELQELVIAQVKAMELQIQALKDRLNNETNAIPKAKRLIDASLRQQKILKNMFVHVSSYLPQRMTMLDLDTTRCLLPEDPKLLNGGSLKPDDPTVIPKEEKSRGSPLLWYITSNELDSLSSYMRGRLTLEKVNATINDMATYAEENAQLILATKKKLEENLWERALELRDITTTELVKRKHFFLETDMKGLALKFDNTEKAILTVLRHLDAKEENLKVVKRKFCLFAAIKVANGGNTQYGMEKLVGNNNYKYWRMCMEAYLQEIDTDDKISEACLRRYLVGGLRKEYRPFVISLQGWSQRPSVEELENLLSNQEALAKQMAKKFESDAVLFSKGKPNNKNTSA
ncbi:spindle and kinetochore-associated protein 1 homolog [Pistacia vera]|uniref:spindle and kinetochore-associated protein 1 homolog n=1 Tax=Pistacia vera TaxID=55513 RepID=UPI0012631409|nr:spindle and kinetochore-associated protein 1 homolog [Pistacia vera]